MGERYCETCGERYEPTTMYPRCGRSAWCWAQHESVTLLPAPVPCRWVRDDTPEGEGGERG